MSSYYGRSADNISNVIKLDNITFNGGTTYALTQNGVAFVPNNSSSLLISIDGVVQQGNFSTNNSNIVFNFSPTSSNTCNWILHIGVGVAYVPAASSITKDKTDFVSTSSSAGLEIKGDGTTDGYIQLSCSQGSHGIKLKSPQHSTSSSYTLTFPGTDPAANKMLQTDGSGNLSFVDAPSGGLKFIQSQIVTSNTTVVNFNDVFSATYDNYFFLFDATLVNSAQMEMRYRTNTPTNDNYTGANTYRYGFGGYSSTGNGVTQNSNANNKWTMGDTTYPAASIGAPAVHGFIHFNTPFTASTQRTWTSTFVVYNNNDDQRAFSGGGRVVNGTQMTGFGFTTSSGDFTKFTGRLYGVVDS